MSPSGSFVVLCFHGVGTPSREREPGEADYWVRPDTFRGMLDVAAGRPDVLLTFDDGNASDIELTLSELDMRGLRARFFPVAGRLDVPGNLTRADVRTLVEHGMAVGSHGMAHRVWRRLDLAAVASEFDEARRVLSEAAGRAVDTAACPLGVYDRRTLRALRDRGYRNVYTSDRLPGRDGDWLQPRYSVHATDTVDDVRQLLEHPPRGLALANARTRVAVKSMR